MHYSSYEDYMQSVLGYTPSGMQNTYTENPCFYEMQPQMNLCCGMQNQDCDMEKFYPDVYRVIYPIVCRECKAKITPLTQETLEKMVDTVYKSVEIDLKVQTTKVEVTKREETRKTEDREDRRVSNTNQALRDLIKILILRELINTGRPPFPGPGGSGRPPFPGGPGMPPPRPPFPGSGGSGRPPFPGGPRGEYVSF